MSRAASDVLAPLRVKDKEAANDRADWAAQKCVWVPDDNEGFVAARIKSEVGDSVVAVKEESRQEVTVPKDEVQLMNPPKFAKSEDMAALTNLNEASVLFNLKDRYYADLIYTYSGLFCVVVNPYKNLPIYSKEIIQEYKGVKRDSLPPHVYAVADEAYRNLIQDKEDQSILCTGESGAGKTENTKKVIQYLAAVASTRGKTKAPGATGGKQFELEDQLLQANPILETFGNASTTKNDNSSRFGKFIRIQFDSAGFIAGANIDVYLLEKSRAVRQNDGERNFHSFYQLLRGANQEYISKLLLEAPSSYKFLTNGERKLIGVDDGREFAQTNQALTVMGLTDAEILSVWRIVSAVLLFGQMEFDQERRTEQAILKAQQPAEKLCHLLGINASEFVKAILRPRMDIGGSKLASEQVAKQQTKEQAEFSAEALAKSLYERLFLWLVQKINTSLTATSRDLHGFIGLLDIAGFEIFKNNSFEQLCINYTNEKLQQLFNHKMFILEQEEYVKEKINWSFIDFGLDLQPTIDLIEQSPGVLATLDDQCIFPKATDTTFLEQMVSKLKDHPKFTKTGLKQEGDFTIMHYAGRVTYSAKDWIVKNKDPLNTSVTQLLEKSTDPFVEKLWRSDISSLVPSGGLRGRGVMRTVAYIYKEQLSALMFTLNSTNPHFVRCIIPNHQKKFGCIDSSLVLDQLRCNGVLEGIRICRQGFPNRIPFPEFRLRYKILTPNVVPAGFIEGRKACELMVTALGLDASQYRIGETKIFFRAGALHELEERRDLMLSKLIVGLQAHCRGFLARKKAKGFSPDAVKIIQRNIRTFMRIREWAWWRLYTKVKPLIPTMSADQKLRDLQAEVERLSKQVESQERDRRELEDSKTSLADEKKRLLEQLKQYEDAAVESQDVITRLTVRKAEVEEELTKVETELGEHMETAHGLLQEKKDLQVELARVKETLKASDAAEARINQLTGEVKEWKSKFDGIFSELHAAQEQVKKLQKDNLSLQEQLDTMAAAKARTERLRQKAQSELDDLTVQLGNERQATSAMQSKQKVHDKQMTDVRTQLEQSTTELERAQADLREAQSKILVLRNDLADMEQRATTAESGKKKLESELEEMLQSAADHNIADLERVRRELLATVDDQKKQILELEDELQLANDAKMRSEVNIAKLTEELRALRESAQDSAAFESMEGKYKALQRQVVELQEDADKERRQRGKLTNEKRKVELELQAIQDHLEEEKKAREREQKLREAAEKRLQQYTAGEVSGVLRDSDVRELDRAKQKLKQNKADMDDLELQVASANAAKRRAERELEDQRELVGIHEKEIMELKSQLRRIMSAMQSGEHGPVTIKWTTTTVDSRKSDSHTESGSGVPHTLDEDA